MQGTNKVGLLKRRKVKLLVFLCVPLISLLCTVALYLFPIPTNDDTRYRAMRREDELIVKARIVERSRFGWVVRPLHLSNFYIKRFEAHRDELLTVGYLTNSSITVTNKTGIDSDILNRLASVVEGTDIEFGRIEWQSNCVEIVCRPKDIPCLRKALEE